MDGFRAWQKTEPFEITAVPEQTGPREQMNARLLQRDEPGVWYRESLGALTCMMEPVPVFRRPVLVKPARLFDRRELRQCRGQQLRCLCRQDLLQLVGEFGNRHDRHEGKGS